MQSLLIISIMLLGVGVGTLLRVGGVEKYRKYLGSIISAIVFLLLFVLGWAIGGNQLLLDGIATLGVEALIITIGAVVGSVLCAWAVHRIFFSSSNDNNNDER